MAKLITVFWRDIPAQVIGRRGRTTAFKELLHPRFQEAIDRAAMRAGRGSSDAYLADWRRETRPCDDDLEQAVHALVKRLEAGFPPETLETVVRAGGVAQADTDPANERVAEPEPPETSDPLVVFTPSGKRTRVRRDTPLLQVARELGVDLDSVCGGRGICGRCKVQIVEGSFPKHGIDSSGEHLSALSEPERRFARRSELPPGHRLACHSRVEGNLVVDVPESSQVHRQVVRKPYQSRDLTVDPVVRLHYVEVPEPSLDRPRGDLQALFTALGEQWQLDDLGCDAHVLRDLQPALREGGRRVTVAVREGRRLVAAWPGFRGRLLGVAVDVGSTTLAAHLCDLATGIVLASAGAMNPQIRFGEDLMSRVSYAMLNPGGDGEMTRVVREALDSLVGELVTEAGAVREEILELTLVGNPIMHHLLLGISPTELGTAPFTLSTDVAVTLRARDLDLDVHPGARAYVLPCIAGHVGADAASVLLAEAPWERRETTLLVDVGTNAEVVLCGRGRILAASSPTGPALEGAQISCGQRAAPGAIERVRIDPSTLEPRFRVIGCELWSDEDGFDEALPSSGVTGLCGTGIIEAIAELFLAGVIDPDGRIDGSAEERSSRIVPEGRTHAFVLHAGTPEIRILQNDVRAIQLAKAALYAGARILMDELGVDAPDRIRLAGAFGSHIDVKYAMVLGLLPDCDLAEVSSAGNAAGTGAVMALLDGASRRSIEERVRSVEKIETAIVASFQEHFVAAIGLPHASDRFPNLERRVSLPERAAALAAKGRGRARGRGSRRKVVAAGEAPGADG